MSGSTVFYPGDHISIHTETIISSGWGWGESVNNRNYFVCENCSSRYLLPEIKGTELIRLVCSGCGGRLKEE